MSTVTAALLGSLLTLAIKWLLDLHTERQRWKREDRLQVERSRREDRIRFHSDRRAAYAKFLAVSYGLYTSAKNHAWKLAKGDENAPPLPYFYDPPVDLSPEYKEVYEVVQLLGTPSVRAAARQHHQNVLRVIGAIYDDDWANQYNDLGREMEASCSVLRSAAREELGIEGFDDEPPTPPTRVIIGHAKPLKQAQEAP